MLTRVCHQLTLEVENVLQVLEVGMDVTVATLTSIQWTAEDYAIAKVVSSSCGLCGKCFTLKRKVKPEGYLGTKPVKLIYEGQSSKQYIFNQILHKDFLSNILKKYNKNVRRTLKRVNGLQSTKRLDKEDMLQWVGRLLWSGLVGFSERPPKELIDISIKRYLSLSPNGQSQDMFTMFKTMANRNVTTFFQEINELQEKLALTFRTIYDPGQTLCIEKYKVDLSNHQPVDLWLALLVDSDTGFICNFLIYSMSQVLRESEQIPLLYIIHKLLYPFCNKNYILQIDGSAHINDTTIREFKKLGIQLAYSGLAEKETLEDCFYFCDWEGYAMFPLNGKDYLSMVFLLFFWLLVHISCINTFILDTLENKDSKEDLSLEEFVECLSREITGVGDYFDSAHNDEVGNPNKDRQRDHYRQETLSGLTYIAHCSK